MSLPLAVDGRGNALVRLVRCDNAELEDATSRTHCPLSLIVVADASTGDVLFGLNHWRREYELPGGMIESEEGFEEAAVRELKEETGIDAVSPDLVGYAQFALENPRRRELGAVYRVQVAGQDAVPGDELVDFVWRKAGEPTDLDISPLDDAIASWAIGT